MAFYAIKLLIQDVKELVTKHVKKSIKAGLNDTNKEMNELAHNRKKWLAIWENREFPLTWNSVNSDKGSYDSLLVILNEDPSQRCLQGLTHSSSSLTYSGLASLLVAFASSSTSQVRAPIVTNGYFCTALPLAVKLMARFKPENSTMAEFATHILVTMFRKMEIHFLPWHRDPTGVGATPRAVQADWWMVIDRKTTPVSMARPSTTSQTSTSIALLKAAEDLSAPWNIPAKLRDMGTLWRKKVLPNEWNIKKASVEHARAFEHSRYVAETYDYVGSNYDGTNWRHHMALVWAILFSRVVPFVAHQKPTNYPKESGSTQATKMVRGIPWIKAGEKRRGVTDPLPYITMMSTAIIALRDPNSPLSIQAGKNKDAVGKPWTDKHGTKEITPFNMVRMGLAKAESYALIERPSWKSNWRFYSDAEVKPTYDRVMNHLLNGQPHGEFLAVEEIFGRDIANMLADKREVVAPAHSRVQAVQVQAVQMPALIKKRKAIYRGNEEGGSRSGGKRRVIELTSDEEVEIEE